MISALKTKCSSYSSCLVKMLTCTSKYLLHFKHLKNWHEIHQNSRCFFFFLPVDVLDSVQMDSGSKSIRTEYSTKKAKKKKQGPPQKHWKNATWPESKCGDYTGGGIFSGDVSCFKHLLTKSNDDKFELSLSHHSFFKLAKSNLVKHAVKEAFRSKSFEVCADSLGKTELLVGFLHGWNKTRWHPCGDE